MNEEHDEKTAERTLTPPATNLADDNPAVQLQPTSLFPTTTKPKRNNPPISNRTDVEWTMSNRRMT